MYVVAAAGVGTIAVDADGLEPMVLLQFYFYTDSIGDKPIKMLDSTKDQRAQDENQEQLGPGKFFAHDDNYPFLQEFSEFIATVSTKSLKSKLMTHHQRIMANAFWEANNYGGSEAKCVKRLTELYGPQWRKITSIAEHMDAPREYCEYVLILDHQRQWEHRKKFAMLASSKTST